MGLPNGYVRPSVKSIRAVHETTYMRSRSSLLWVIVFSLVNVVFALIELGTYFLFSATVPFWVAASGRLGFEKYGSSAYLIIGGTIALFMIGVYFLFWCMSKRHREWMDAATVCFGLDCVGMILLIGFDIAFIIDYVFHAYVMYQLVVGSITAHKLAKLPPEDPIAIEPEAPQTAEQDMTEASPAAEETTAEAPAEEAPVAPVTDEAAANEAEPIPDETGRKDYRGKTIPANYYRGLEAVGGKLAFDDLGMTFRSHALNIQTGETRIEYKDIVNAQTRGLLTEISVYTKDGKDHRFVVYHRKDVVAFLESVKG